MSQVDRVREQIRQKQQAAAAAAEAGGSKGRGDGKRGGRGRGGGRTSKAAKLHQDATPGSAGGTGPAGSIKATLMSATTMRPTAVKEEKRKLEAQRAAAGPRPINMLLKDVLDLLKEKRPNPVTASDIFAAKGIEVSELPELQQQLREHSNIDQTPSGGYVFKATHQLDGKDDLLRLIHKPRDPRGIMVEDLPDSYPTVLTDLQTLKDESKIYVVNLGGVEVAYPRDASEQGNIILDDEVHKLFHETQIPAEASEIQAALRTAKLEPAARVPPRERQKKGPKERKKPKSRQFNKVTNTHMPELFVGEAPDQIDNK